MVPDQALLAEIYRRKLAQAKRFSPEERLLASLAHSDAMVELMRAGVRDQFPSASEDEITRLMQERIERVRQRQNRR